MNFLPLVRRELWVGARAPMTYRIRLYTAGVSFLLCLAIYARSRAVPGNNPGSTLFITLTILAMVYGLFEGARRTADIISQERREGTLGLLFLTDLKGYDVVLGKLAGSSLITFYSFLAFFPVLALSLLMGGVTQAEFARVCAVLVNTLFFSLSAGMWVSARNYHGHRAMAGAAGLAVGLAAGLPLLDLMLWQTPRGGVDRILFSLGSPAMGCYQAFAAPFQNAPHRYWICLGIVHLMSWGLLWRAGAKVGGQWRAVDQAPGLWQRWMRLLAHQGPAARRPGGAAGPVKNPVAWLAQRHAPGGQVLWISLAVGAGALLWRLRDNNSLNERTEAFLVGVVVGFALLTLMIHISWLTCRWAVETREAGMVELLLTTPLTVQGILRGQRMAMRHLLLWPLLAVLVLMSFGWINDWLLGGNRSMATMGTNAQISVAGSSPADLIRFFAAVYAASWLGMWFGMSVTKPAQAAAKTFLFGFLLPGVAAGFVSAFLIFGISTTFNLFGTSISQVMEITVNISIEIAICLALAAWARNRLRRNYRRVAAGTGQDEPRLTSKWTRRNARRVVNV